MKAIFTITIAVFFAAKTTSAQVDTINANNNSLQTSKLKEQVNTYLVYFTDSLFNLKTTGDIWERRVLFTTRNNQPVVVFDWNWYRHDSLLATVKNICNRTTLAPIFHKAVYPGKGIIAYDYKDGFMIPSDTVKNNAVLQKPKVALDFPVISWEEDLETYPLLPINKIGQKFDIAFFDPNENAATYHRYTVIAKEKLELNNDLNVDCWLLKINYSKDSYAIFWLTEKSKEVIKMKEYFNGNYRFKVKLF